MDRAAKGGFLDVLQFLWQEGQQCTTVHIEQITERMVSLHGTRSEPSRTDGLSRTFPAQAGERLYAGEQLHDAARHMQNLVVSNSPYLCIAYLTGGKQPNTFEKTGTTIAFRSSCHHPIESVKDADGVFGT